MTMADERTVESDAWAVISNLRDQHPRVPNDCPTDYIVEALAAAGLLAASAPGTLGAQSRADDADAIAAVALALGKALGEIASMVGLNPDDGELEPILNRVRKLAEKGA